MTTPQNHNYSFAPLSEKEVHQLRSLEQQLSQELNKSIVILAYENQVH
jgi:hypothetical protein